MSPTPFAHASKRHTDTLIYLLLVYGHFSLRMSSKTCSTSNFQVGQALGLAGGGRGGAGGGPGPDEAAEGRLPAQVGQEGQGGRPGQEGAPQVGQEDAEQVRSGDSACCCC